VFCLMSSTQLDGASSQAASQGMELAAGGAMTLFLHDPLGALCALAGVKELSYADFVKCEQLLVEGCREISSALCCCDDTPAAALAFMQDAFLRTLLLRFVLCSRVFALHKTTKDFHTRHRLALPSSEPPLPAAVLTHATTTNLVSQLATALGVASQFLAPTSEAP